MTNNEPHRVRAHAYAQAEMSSAGVSLLLLLVQAAVSAAFYPVQPTVHSGYENRLCRVPFGFRPRTCGPHDVIAEIAEPACEYIYG